MPDNDDRKHKHHDPGGWESSSHGGGHVWPKGTSVPAADASVAGPSSPPGPPTPPPIIPRPEGPPRKGPRSRDMDPTAVNTAMYDARFGHVTDRSRMESIAKLGLDPAFGGRDGAGDAFLAADPENKSRIKTARKFNRDSKDHVHVSKGQETIDAYSDTLRAGNKDPVALTVYLDASRTRGPGADLQQDDRHPHDTTHPITNEKIPQSYKTKVRIPPANIMTEGMVLGDKNTLRPPGAIGADYAPAPMVEAIRSYMGPDYRSNTKMVEGMRRAQYFEAYGGDISSEYDTSPSPSPRETVPGAGPMRLASSLPGTSQSTSHAPPSSSRSMDPHAPPSTTKKRGKSF